MSVEALLAEIEGRGVTLDLCGDGWLRIRGPQGGMTPALRLAVWDNRLAVLRELERRYLSSDPRPDLPSDHDLWGRLLRRAYDLDGQDRGGLFGTLHGLRIYGGRLEVGCEGVSLVTSEIEDDYAAEQVHRLWGEQAQHGRMLAHLLEQLGRE
ncbi:MAG: hypothetical protein ACYC4L_19265 [Chloroflexota bacterium]